MFCYINSWFKRKNNPAFNWERQTWALTLLLLESFQEPQKLALLPLLLSPQSLPLVSPLLEVPPLLQYLEVGCLSLESFEFSHCCHFYHCFINEPNYYLSLVFTDFEVLAFGYGIASLSIDTCARIPGLGLCRGWNSVPTTRVLGWC